MLKNKGNAREKRSNGFGSSGATTLIAAGTEIVGSINFSGHLDIEGVIRGTIDAVAEDEDAMVRIVNTGRVEGEIHAPSIAVYGTLTGDVYSSKHLLLASKAWVRGDIHYTKMEMDAGAQVEGNLKYAGSDSGREDPEPDISPSKGGINAASDRSLGDSSPQGVANQSSFDGSSAPPQAAKG